MGDDELLVWLRDVQHSKKAQVLSKSLIERKLYRPAYIADPMPKNDKSMEAYQIAQTRRPLLRMAHPADRLKVERDLASIVGIDEKDIIVYWPQNAPGLQKVQHYVQHARDKMPSVVGNENNRRILERHLSLWKIFVFVNPLLDSVVTKNVSYAAAGMFALESILDSPI